MVPRFHPSNYSPQPPCTGVPSKPAFHLLSRLGTENNSCTAVRPQMVSMFVNCRPVAFAITQTNLRHYRGREPRKAASTGSWRLQSGYRAYGQNYILGYKRNRRQADSAWTLEDTLRRMSCRAGYIIGMGIYYSSRTCGAVREHLMLFLRRHIHFVLSKEAISPRPSLN